MRMILHHTYRILHLSFAYLFSASIDHVLKPLALVGDWALTRIVLALDFLIPSQALALDNGHAFRPSRDVTFLTTGFHRLAQSRTMLGDPDDEDGQGDGGDEIAEDIRKR